MFQEDKSIGVGLTPAAPLEPWQCILLNAATYLRRYGWQQAAYGGDGEPACIVGAVKSTIIYNEQKDIVMEALQRLRIFTGHQLNYTTTIVSWNDQDGQTAENVIATMEACANVSGR